MHPLGEDRAWNNETWEEFKNRAAALLPALGSALNDDPLRAGDIIRDAIKQARQDGRTSLLLQLLQQMDVLRELYITWGRFYDMMALKPVKASPDDRG